MHFNFPPIDRNFVAQDAERSMLRLRNSASLVGEDFVAAEIVDQSLKWLLRLGGPGVPAFVVQVLHGELGEPAAKTAWNLFGRGITIAGPKGKDVCVSVAAYCLSNGTLDVLRTLVEAGVPPVVNPGMFGPHKLTISMWLNMLCTTQNERSHPQFGGMVDHGGLVELAAVNYDYFPNHAQSALELAWALNREHVGFGRLVEDPSPAGAIVRAFVMHKTLESNAALAPIEPAISTTPPAPSRAYRAGI